MVKKVKNGFLGAFREVEREEVLATMENNEQPQLARLLEMRLLNAKSKKG